MNTQLSFVLKLNEAKEFISKVQEAEKIYQKIYDDVAKYRWLRMPDSSISEQENFLYVTECDMEHLNLEPFDDQVEKYKWAPKYTEMALPRALSLRYNVCLSYAYDKNILMQLAATKNLTAKWGKEDFLEAQKVLKEWITSKKLAYQVLHDFASQMDSMRPSFTRGKHVLGRRCVKIVDLERIWFEKKLKNTKTHEYPEIFLEFTCNSCKQFALKSDELMNQLAPHFRTILREYYSDPEVAEEIPLFIDAALQCKNILQNYLSFKVYTTYEAKPDWLKSTASEFLGYNKSLIFMYAPNKYPDDKGFILCLSLSFETLVNRCDDEWCKDDRLAPHTGSVIHHALRFNLAEFDIFYKKLIEIIDQNFSS